MCRLSDLGADWCLGDRISATSLKVSKVEMDESGCLRIAEVDFFAFSMSDMSRGTEWCARIASQVCIHRDVSICLSSKCYFDVSQAQTCDVGDGFEVAIVHLTAQSLMSRNRDTRWCVQTSVAMYIDGDVVENVLGSAQRRCGVDVHEGRALRSLR